LGLAKAAITDARGVSLRPASVLGEPYARSSVCGGKVERAGGTTARKKSDLRAPYEVGEKDVAKPAGKAFLALNTSTWSEQYRLDAHDCEKAWDWRAQQRR
jgi:hypothetical protein